MVKSLQPEIQKNMHVIAKEEAEVERLEKQVEQAETKLDKDKTDLMRLKNDVATGKDVYHYAGRTYTVSQVKADLTNRFDRVKTTDATIGSLRDILTARKQGLEAGRQKLEAMLAAKQQLLAKIENLEARMKMVEVAQASSAYSFDDSQLGQVKELVDDLQAEDSSGRKAGHRRRLVPRPDSADSPAADDIVDQVAQYLGEKSIKVAEVSAPKAE